MYNYNVPIFLIGHGARLQVDILICQMWGEITTIYIENFSYTYIIHPWKVIGYYVTLCMKVL